MKDAPRDRWLALNYAAAIFTSAFLLFQIQPLVTKHILPWFGGGPAVWTTCLLFFQTLLFFGYAYAHFLHSRLRVQQQALVHVALIAAAIALGSVLPGARWEPRGGENPIRSILAMLSVSVGLPYFVLSATGPLLQAWFARSFPGRSPYRLYALSNLGSLLALVSYPFFFERTFNLPRQAHLWLAGFVFYALLCAYAAWKLWTRSRVSPIEDSPGRTRENKSALRKKNKSPTHDHEVHNPESQRDSSTCPPPRWFQRVLWLILPAFASIMLMSTTNHISTDIAVMPFLWIVPLALYLITFIIAFDQPAWYRRLPVTVLMLVAVYGTAMVHFLGVGTSRLFDAGTLGLFYSTFSGPGATSPEFDVSTMTFLVVNFTSMFAICMLCHGELVRQRPDPRYLTSFYLMIAAGGALGGMFVTLLAPQIFTTYYEWELALFIACVFAIGVLLRALVNFVFADDTGPRRPSHYAMLGVVVAAVFLPSAVMLLDLTEFLQPPAEEAHLRTRGFFGTLSVLERGEAGTKRHGYFIKHGTITHGAQFSHPTRRREAISYYGHESGVGRALDYYFAKLESNPMKLGVVGLGAGTLATYADAGDSVVFYEIDPTIIDITESARWFTYLRDCRERGAQCEIRLGDARLTLKHELERHQPQQYHALVLDAFSGDSVPAHLLTIEAFELYLAHLAGGDEPGAVIAHISNRYLNLQPVVRGIAQHFGLYAIRIDSEDDKTKALVSADWVVLTHNSQLAAELSHFATPFDPGPAIFWTDTHSSLFDVLK